MFPVLLKVPEVDPASLTGGFNSRGGCAELFLPPANEVWGKEMFSQACVILFTGVYIQGGSASRGVYRRGGAYLRVVSTSGGVYLWGCLPPGVSTSRGSLHPRGVCIQGGVYLQGVYLQGGVYLRGCLPPGVVCIQEGSATRGSLPPELGLHWGWVLPPGGSTFRGEFCLQHGCIRGRGG